MILTIYLIGCLLSFAFTILIKRRNDGYITIGGLIVVTLFATLSWIGLFIGLLVVMIVELEDIWGRKLF